MSRAVAVALVTCSFLLGGVDAHAQFVRDMPPRGSIEITGGALFARGYELETVNAELTRATGDDPFELFSAEGRTGGFPGAHVSLGWYVTRAISVEAGARYAKPELSYALSGDAESAGDLRAVETFSHYVFDASVLFHFNDAAFAGGRAVPFVSGGGGYLRELYAGNELVETGAEVHGTAGVKYWFGGGSRRLGLRIEAGLSLRQGGVVAEDERRTTPIVLAGLGVLF